MIDPVIFLPLVILGLVSSTHCIGMCGGIMGALTMAIPAEAKAKRWLILVAYNFGRILSYALMGMLAGLFAEQFAVIGGGTILRLIAGILLVAMGLYLADWWRGLTKLETLGRYLWVYIQPVGKKLMPVNNLPKALLLGALWGWLPCGLVYAALATAMTQPAPGLAAAAMFAFGLGTLPSVLASGIAAQQLTRLLRQRKLRLGMALIIITFGLWTIWGSLGHAHQHQHMEQGSSMTDDHSGMDHSKMNHAEMDHSHMNHATMNHGATSSQDVNESANSSASDSALERQRTELNPAAVEDGLSSDSSSEADHAHHH